MSANLETVTFETLCAASVMQRHLPMLVAGGLPDADRMVHSHFLTYLVTAGQAAGRPAVAEYPVLSDDESVRVLGDVRVDSVWFDPSTLVPEVAFEFERFEPRHELKLREKIENLAIASHQVSSLRLTVLVYWVRSGAAPRAMANLVKGYHQGFRRHGREVKPAACPLMSIKCVMRESGEKLVFSEFLRETRPD